MVTMYAVSCKSQFPAPEWNPEIPNFALKSSIEQRGKSTHAASKHSEREVPHQEMVSRFLPRYLLSPNSCTQGIQACSYRQGICAFKQCLGSGTCTYRR